MLASHSLQQLAPGENIDIKIIQCDYIYEIRQQRFNKMTGKYLIQYIFWFPLLASRVYDWAIFTKTVNQ